MDSAALIRTPLDSHMPKAFYEASYNLVQYRRHKFGGCVPASLLAN